MKAANAIYSRGSTRKQDQEHGLAAQVHACKRFLEDRKMTGPVRIFREQASGRRDDRAVLKELLHEAAMHRFTALVVFRLDRLSRSGIPEMFRVLKALQGSGVRVYSVSESWWDPDAPTAELILAVLAWAAAFESRSIGERVASGIASRRAEAEKRGRPFVWGRAHTSKVTNHPELPERAAQLRKDGRSWTEIAKALGVGRTTARRLCQISRAKRGLPSRKAGGALGGPSE